LRTDLQDVVADGEIGLSADVVIVGAGAVGLALGVTLARDGRDVLILEAGGESLDEAGQRLFSHVTLSGRPWGGARVGRYRVLGGTTTMWGGQVVPIEPTAMAERSWAPGGAWPIGFEELAPWLGSARALLGMGDEDAGEIWARAGGPASGDFGPGVECFLAEWLAEPNLARLFAADISRSKALRVAAHGCVVALEFDDQQERVTALRVLGPRGRPIRVTGERVVLACGTLEIVRLLSSPLADGRRAPWAGRPWLGRGFMDHLDVSAGTLAILDRQRFHDIFDNLFFAGRKFTPKLKLSPSAQHQHHLLGIAGHMMFDSAYREDLDNLKMFAKALTRGRAPSNLLAMPAHVLGVMRVAVPLAVRYLKSHRVLNLADRGVKFRLTAEQAPVAQSRIAITDRRDFLGLPTLDVRWTICGRELETMAVFAELTAAALKSRGLAELTIDPRLAGRDPAFLDQAVDAYHHMGGARMADRPTDGVVDRDLKVHGTGNLYVAGAAVFPSASFANPTLTAIALALRLADHLGART
jgi:choline dehydrogenase-like flavoprotein